MWLLRTDTAELHYFARNFDAPGGYAILSHTWERNEQSFQHLQAVIAQCRGVGTKPRDHLALSLKIRNCCVLAEKNGYRWVWIDSCCIDKTSSSELSEAINSMYQWYKESEICYAYLADVPRDCDLHAPGSAFRKSRWHTRGWTLQELIAPDFVIFLSADWHELGNRAALAGLLEEITGVPSEVLTGEAMPAKYSVCLRMHWASKRKTTRVEDEAYCLMGLFGVSMPTNYGEGKKAFIRLQYEIMQHNSDMSLFAFGYRVHQNHGFTFHPYSKQLNSAGMYLMADSPREFYDQFHYIPTHGSSLQQYPPPRHLTAPGALDTIELPRVTVTSYGVELRAPIHEADGITIAVIMCEGGGRHWGLFLTRDERGNDPKRPRYFASCTYSKPDTGSARYAARLADLGDNLYGLTFNGKPAKASWRTIYVVPTVSDSIDGSMIWPNLVINYDPASRFRIPRWIIARLATLQFQVAQIRSTEALQVVKIFPTSDHDACRIFVSLGSCTEHHQRDPDKPLDLWAKVDVVSLIDMDTFTHDCPEDHIESWVMRSKVFGNGDRKVRLSFTPSTRMLEDVLVTRLELLGPVFEEMVQDATVSFPSLADLEKDRSRSTPSDSTAPISPRTLAQIESPSSRSPSSTSTSASHT